MNKDIIDFIQSQRVCVLAVEMLDGSPHAATVHFAYDIERNIFYFETYPAYRKAEPITENIETRISLVIGFDESNMKTLQIDGIASLIHIDEQEQFNRVYLGKFPDKKEKAQSGAFVMFMCKPIWWRFTDWTRPEGKLILTSDDK